MNKYFVLIVLSLMVLASGTIAKNSVIQTNTQDANGTLDDNVNQTTSNDALLIGNSNNMDMISDQDAIGNMVGTSIMQDNMNAIDLMGCGMDLDQINKQIANENLMSIITQGNSNTAALAGMDTIAAQVNIQIANKNELSTIGQDGDNIINVMGGNGANLAQLDIENANKNLLCDIDQSWEFNLNVMGSVDASQTTIQDANFNLGSMIHQDGDNTASLINTDSTQTDSQTALHNTGGSISQVADNTVTDLL